MNAGRVGAGGSVAPKESAPRPHPSGSDLGAWAKKNSLQK